MIAYRKTEAALSTGISSFAPLLGRILQYIAYIIAKSERFTTCFDLRRPLGACERRSRQVDEHRIATFGAHEAANDWEVLFEPADP